MINQFQQNNTELDKFLVEKYQVDDDNNNEDDAMRNNQISSVNNRVLIQQQQQHIHQNKRSVQSLSDLLGYISPTKLNNMEQCKDKLDHLCLNMLDERVPGK